MARVEQIRLIPIVIPGGNSFGRRYKKDGRTCQRNGGEFLSQIISVRQMVIQLLKHFFLDTQPDLCSSLQKTPAPWSCHLKWYQCGEIKSGEPARPGKLARLADDDQLCQ